MDNKIETRELFVDEVLPLDEQGIEIDFIEEKDAEEIPRPHLVFLISGIRTSGEWVQDTKDSQFSAVSGREIIFESIRGNGGSLGRLSSWHLVSRLGLSRFRRNFINQIAAGLDRYPEAQVSIFAHSMGSALFSEIASDVKETLSVRNRHVEHIIFLGSICHRGKTSPVADLCGRFTNDVGVQDMWPFRASVVRPFTYSDVGLWGFGDNTAHDERFFDNDHTSCTSQAHLQQYLIPLLDPEGSVTRDRSMIEKRPKYRHEIYVYVRRVALIALALIPVVSAVIWISVGFLWGLSVLVGSLFLWTTALLRFR